MKIILSRKGVDSAAGKCASPIIEGRPVSMCIPAVKMPTPTRYEQLSGPIAEMVADLSGGRLGPHTPCHLDPDIDAAALDRPPGWRGALGQVGAAQSHLDNQGVGVGDVFVFWGLFRPAKRTDRWRYVGTREHRIFGWLQVADVVRVGTDPGPALSSYPWLRDHPHVRPGWPAKNTVYVATERLSLAGQTTTHPGWGALSRGRRLTVDRRSPSMWNAPEWLDPRRGGAGMTFHKDASYLDDGTMKSAARGQEFVADVGDRLDAIEWLHALIEDGA